MRKRDAIPCAVGLDIGGTKINAGCIDRMGKVIVETIVPTCAQERRVMEQACLAVDMALEKLQNMHDFYEIQGIGVGSAGQIDFLWGNVLSATDLLPGYKGTPIRSILQERYGFPVFVDNDVNVLAMAEKHYGMGRNSRHMVCLALGTGVGGAVIVDGTLLHGAKGAAGELGHCSVNYRGPKCNCGNHGCLELYASGTGLLRMLNERRAQAGMPPLDDARAVFKGLESHDKIAAEVFDEMTDALATALAGFIHAFHPEWVIIGGGVADSLRPYIGCIRTKTEKRSMPSMFRDVRIELSQLGGKGGMVGAAAQIWEYGSLIDA